MEKQRERTAQLDFAPEHDRWEISVPQGFKYQGIAKLTETLLSPKVLEKLRSDCGECLSGKPLFIKERFEDEVIVDLDSMEIGGFH